MCQEKGTKEKRVDIPHGLKECVQRQETLGVHERFPLFELF